MWVLLCPLITWSALAQPAIVVVSEVSALLWLLFAFLAWAQQAIVVAGAKGEGADLTSRRSVGVCSAGH